MATKKQGQSLADKYAALSLKQQKAAKVLAVCAAAFVLTVLITAIAVVVTGKGTAASEAGEENYDKDAFVLDTTSNAILSQTGDGGADYLSQTVFVGDSNTVRMYNYGLLTLDQYVGIEGLGVQGVVSNACVYFTGDTTAYTIPQALSMMKPRRIVVMLGTNNADGSMTADAFISEYRSMLNALKSTYAYCDILVAAVPPVPENHSNYPNMKMQIIDSFNQALLTMCQEDGYKFLNTSEVLKGSDGFGVKTYYDSNDIHFTKSGLDALLQYVRTHAYDAQDRRPDTSNIPVRALAPKTEATPTPTATATAFTASYYTASASQGLVERGGTQEESIKIDVNATDSVTVTAVPKEGYTFSKWSDGVTTASRTDTNFTQSLSVTATFVSDSLTLTLNPSATSVNAGSVTTITASVSGASSDASKVDWFINNSKVSTGSSYPYTAPAGQSGSVTVTASVTANGKTATATATIHVIGPTPTAAPTPTPAPTAEPTPTPEPTYTYEVTTVEPTCTEQGYTLHKCNEDDSKSFRDNYTDALGHSFENGVCTRCGAAEG